MFNTYLDVRGLWYVIYIPRCERTVEQSFLNTLVTDHDVFCTRLHFLFCFWTTKDVGRCLEEIFWRDRDLGYGVWLGLRSLNTIKHHHQWQREELYV
jgi:hypothetical protein